MPTVGNSRRKETLHQDLVTSAGLGCPGSGPLLPEDVVDLVREKLIADASGAKDWFSLALCSKRHWQRAQISPPPRELTKKLWRRRGYEAGRAHIAVEAYHLAVQTSFCAVAMSTILRKTHRSAMRRAGMVEPGELATTWTSLRLHTVAYHAYKEVTHVIGRIWEQEESVRRRFPPDRFFYARETIPWPILTSLGGGLAGVCGWKLATFAASVVAPSVHSDPAPAPGWEGCIGACFGILLWARILADPAQKLLVRLSRHLDKEEQSSNAQHQALVREQWAAVDEVRRKCRDIVNCFPVRQESPTLTDAD